MQETTIHIRQSAARFSMGETEKAASQAAREFHERKRANPNICYCTASPGKAYDSVTDALAAGERSENICTNCAGFDVSGQGVFHTETWLQTWVRRLPLSRRSIPLSEAVCYQCLEPGAYVYDDTRVVMSRPGKFYRPINCKGCGWKTDVGNPDFLKENIRKGDYVVVRDVAYFVDSIEGDWIEAIGTAYGRDGNYSTNWQFTRDEWVRALVAELER